MELEIIVDDMLFVVNVSHYAGETSVEVESVWEVVGEDYILVKDTQEVIERYWDDVLKGVEKAINSLREDHEAYLEAMSEG